MTNPRTPGGPSAGLDPSIGQIPIQTAPTTGSVHTSRRRKSYWVGCSNSGPFAIRALGPSVTPQVQELARKQSVTFRLPAAQKEKNSWCIIPPSLASFRCRYFLHHLPGVQGPRDVWVVRCSETMALAWALQQCTVWLGAPRNILRHHPGPSQGSHTSHWQGWPVKYLHVGGCGGGTGVFPKHLRRDWASWWGTRMLGGVINHYI